MNEFYAWHYLDGRMTQFEQITPSLCREWSLGHDNVLIKNGGGNHPMSKKAIVRRLTPMECERLQGFPDGWTDIGEWTDSKGKKRKSTDTLRYQALGNSIAVGYANNKQGFWCWLAERMVDQIRAEGVEEPTMASLFDGIGGFPLAFSAYGCRPVWASKIEEFPIAVTKKHFPEEETDNEKQDTTNQSQGGIREPL